MNGHLRSGRGWLDPFARPRARAEGVGETLVSDDGTETKSAPDRLDEAALR